MIIRFWRWARRVPPGEQGPHVPAPGEDFNYRDNRGAARTWGRPVPTEGYEQAVARIAALLPYRSTGRVLTRGEQAFWHPLRVAVGNQYLIMCKVRLADLAEVRDHRPDSRRRFRDIEGFHVDFVLCDTRTTAPLLVIELDDRSHDSAVVNSRDRFKDAVLKAAGLPIYRVKCQQAYAPTELSAEIGRRVRWVRFGG